MRANHPPLLQVRALAKSFRGLRALDAYELDLAQGAIHGVIGPNGAGKTTLFNLLTGLLKPTSGTIYLDGQNITGLPTHRIAALGMTRTFQNIRLFGALTVLENVKVALSSQLRENLFATLVSAPSFRRTENALEQRALALLERIGIAERHSQIADSLPYGDQRKLEIARALAINPRILLLDEPTAGMNPQETQQVLRLIRSLRDELGITLIVIAHDIPLVMNLCEEIQVLNYGRVLAQGSPQTVRSNPEVIAAYLGQAYTPNTIV